MEKNNGLNSLGGFNVIIDALSDRPGSGIDNQDQWTDLNIEDQNLTDEELEELKKDAIVPPVKLNKQSKKQSEEDENEEEDGSNNESHADDNADDGESKRSSRKSSAKSDGGNGSKSSKSESDNDDTADANAEPTDDADADEDDGQVESFFDAISEQLGWEFDEDEEKPHTVEELIQYFQDVIEENSAPQYASEEVKEIDEFVRNGGDLQKYFSAAPTLDLDNIEIEDNEDLQKQVVKQLLVEQGYSDKSIERKLKKYEEAGILEEEAQDAVDALKDIAGKKKQELLQQQKIEHEQMVQNQQKFYGSVVSTIKDLKDIRGIAIPEKDKRVLLDYIFKPDAKGVTQYQKDYAKNVKNLIESAYFTMKGDALLDTAKKVGSTSAVKKFKQSLRTNTVSKGSKKMSQPQGSDIWTNAVQSLFK